MIEQMTLILDAFEDRSTPLTLVEVARSTNLPRCTVHRILEQLVKLSWLEQSPFGYCLGRRSRQLGVGDRAQADLRAAAAPMLHELHLRTGLLAHLAILDGAGVEYLDKVGGSRGSIRRTPTSWLSRPALAGPGLAPVRAVTTTR